MGRKCTNELIYNNTTSITNTGSEHIINKNNQYNNEYIDFGNASTINELKVSGKLENQKLK